MRTPVNRPASDPAVSQETLLESLRRDAFAAHSGVELLEARPGYARTQLAVGPQHLNSVELVHGGALFTLAAVAMFAACNASGKMSLGINLNLSCLQSARTGKLVAEAREVARTRRLATCVVEVTDEQGTLLATLNATAYILNGKAFPPSRS